MRWIFLYQASNSIWFCVSTMLNEPVSIGCRDIKITQIVSKSFWVNLGIYGRHNTRCYRRSDARRDLKADRLTTPALDP